MPKHAPARARACFIAIAFTACTQPPPGQFQFTPTQPALFAGGGALVNAWADFDGDGDPDLFVGFNGQGNRLYQNDDGRYTDIAAGAGLADTLHTRSAAWGDYDGDGDPDLVLGFAIPQGASAEAPSVATASVVRLYRNDDGHFTDVTDDAGLAVPAGATRQFAWVDVDGDGDLDLFTAFRDGPNRLYRNDGGHFTDIAPDIGLADPRRTVGAVWFDYDDDGDLDLFVANMDGDANGLFRNDGSHFTDVAAQAGVAWGGRAPHDSTNGTVRPCAADVDNDGNIDLFMANYGPNGLFLNQDDGAFRDVSKASGIAIDGRYDTCAFADVDNDGDLDLFVNGTITHGEQYRDYLFRNDSMRFTDVTPAVILGLHADHGAQWADYDHDGALDLALAGAEPDSGTHALLHNDLPAEQARRFIDVRVLGPGGQHLPGAEVRLYDQAGDLLGTRLVDTGSGYNSQNVLPVHFGAPGPGPFDIEATYPAAGLRMAGTVRGVTAGSVVAVRVAAPKAPSPLTHPALLH
ncbi:MAG: CRTAC1 family protein [Gemmatimonadota bacterium]|jgi:hypothetical protein